MSEVAGPTYGSPGSASRRALPTAKASLTYCLTSGFGRQKTMFGSLYISHRTPRPRKCLAAAAAQRANAARPSSLAGDSPWS